MAALFVKMAHLGLHGRVILCCSCSIIAYITHQEEEEEAAERVQNQLAIVFNTRHFREPPAGTICKQD